MVNDGVPEQEVSRMEDGDFPWFYQPGKVYSDSSKAVYSKHVNLHLGRAYDSLPAKTYCDLAGI